MSNAEPIRFYNARRALYADKPVNPNRPTISELYERSFVGREAKLSTPAIVSQKYLGIFKRYSPSIATWGLVGVAGAYFVIQPNLPRLWEAVKVEIFGIVKEE